MLKALELVGFKSFADKTRFEFGAGITVVVGPNGSGKSNVVDAIKWVLGEQSVKSLRGKEMADVIFNGSGSRQPLHTAEATLSFNNASGFFDIETPEVHIGRRVYRSGEGEYLINGQPSRRKDIRDLLAGSGVGSDGYSIIEQGKVDALLQSSPRDRRMVFEEAAGISRFKAKKLETLRRLERVEQNLVRLKDIVDEVESRLKTVRMQATKARRYRDYTSRLQQLRTQVALVDWRKSTEQLAELDAQCAEFEQQVHDSHSQAEELEHQVEQLDAAAVEINERARTAESLVTRNREQIAGHQSSISHDLLRLVDLESEIRRHRRQLALMNAKAAEALEQGRKTEGELEVAQAQHEHLAQQLADDERALTELTQQLDALRETNEQRRTAYLGKMRQVAALGNQISALESQVENAAAAQERSEHRLRELQAAQSKLDDELTLQRAAEIEAARAAESLEREVNALIAQMTRRREKREALAANLADLRQRHSGAFERASVLEELERRYEGVNAGAREILLSAQKSKQGPWKSIEGLVAELFHVNMEVAPLVELALGETVGHLVVNDLPQLLEHVKQIGYQPQSRVHFLALQNPGTVETGPDLDNRPGVVGRADVFVETPARFRPLAKRLLGHVWVVENIEAATNLLPEVGPRAKFVTLHGEVITGDGQLSLGPQKSSTGLISRRSELRSLKQTIAQLTENIQQAQAQLEQLDEQLADDRRRRDEFISQQKGAAETLAACRLRLHAAEERSHEAARQQQHLEDERQTAKTSHAAATKSLSECRETLSQSENELGQIDAEIAADARQISELDQSRQTYVRATTSAKVSLATSEERLENLQARLRQAQQDHQERLRASDEHRHELTACQTRATETERAVLTSESAVALLYLQRERLEVECTELVALRAQQQTERAAHAHKAQRLRENARKVEQKLHEQQLTAGQIRTSRDTLAARLRDEYGIELDQTEGEPDEEERRQRDQVDGEIAELRDKINRLGNVNLEALEELEGLEERFGQLSSQYDDLTGAKNSLQQIINKINADSRTLFADTLETVRGHFQALFRKLFGGGQADIVLEEGVDMLDAGIDIVARPPGKALRSIMLLSGGEKTLTCVAMLLAIFRSRPSPFCVLDEVDAALDEANIERFVGVLKEFLQYTQFVVVTHSKKTMTCAQTLYGVTMQESGVSKRVSVRFEDVSDNGEILRDDDAPEAETQRNGAENDGMEEAKNETDDETQAA